MPLSPLTAVFLIVLVDVLGFTIILPLLPFYVEHFGAGPAVVGALMASYAACQLISGPFLGRWSDQIGRRPLLLLSQCGSCAGFLILAFAPSLPFVFLGRIIDGFTAGNISLAQATISDFTPPAERAKAFGKIGVAFSISFLIGPAIAGYLARFGYKVPILAGAALSLTSIIATATLLPSKPRDPDAPPARSLRVVDWRPILSAFQVPGLRLRLAQFFVFILSFSMYTSCLALFAGRRLTMDGKFFGPSEVAYILAYGGLLGIILQMALMGRLVDRFGERRLVSGGLLAMVLGYGILSTASGLPVALAAVTFSSLGHGVLRPSLTSLVTQAAPRGEQGAILGVNQSMQATAQILAPLIGGSLIQAGLTSTWALTAAAFAGVGLTAQIVGRGDGPRLTE